MSSLSTAVRRLSRSICAATPAAALFCSLHLLAAPARAQQASAPDAGFAIRADWLQAGAMPLDRKTLHSGSAVFAKETVDWAIDLGWLRVARNLSTVQGGFVALERRIHLGDLVVLPGLGAFGGSGEASRDTTGYNWLGLSATDVGHVPRYSRSRAVTFGGGASLAIEYPAGSVVGLRASVAQWMFSGQPLTGDRQRTMAGAGLTVRFGTGAAATPVPASAPRREDPR